MVIRKDKGMPVYEVHYRHPETSHNPIGGWSIRFVEAANADAAQEEALDSIFEYVSEESLEYIAAPIVTLCKEYKSWDELETSRNVNRPKQGHIRGRKEIPIVQEALDWIEENL